MCPWKSPYSLRIPVLALGTLRNKTEVPDLEAKCSGIYKEAGAAQEIGKTITTLFIEKKAMQAGLYYFFWTEPSPCERLFNEISKQTTTKRAATTPVLCLHFAICCFCCVLFCGM